MCPSSVRPAVWTTSMRPANDELALGASDTSKSAAKVVPVVGKFRSVQAALRYLSSHNGNRKGAHELEDALAKLKQLGYTKGS